MLPWLAMAVKLLVCRSVPDGSCWQSCAVALPSSLIGSTAATDAFLLCSIRTHSFHASIAALAALLMASLPVLASFFTFFPASVFISNSDETAWDASSFKASTARASSAASPVAALLQAVVAVLRSFKRSGSETCDGAMTCNASWVQSRSTLRGKRDGRTLKVGS